MISVILAAGYATRMYPLTEHFPKPLLPVAGKPILSRLLNDIDRIPEISRHVVISNHRFIEHFEAWKSELLLTKPVELLNDGSTENGNRLGAVKDVQFAIDAFGLNDDLLVLAGDNLLTFSLQSLADACHRTGHTTVFCYEEPDTNALKRSGVLVKDADGRILQMLEKPVDPPSHWAVPPFYAYAKKDLPLVKKGIESGIPTDAPGSFIAWLCRQVLVYAILMPGKRIDVGDLASYNRIKDQF